MREPCGRRPWSVFVVEGDGQVDLSPEQQRIRLTLLKLTECDLNCRMARPQACERGRDDGGRRRDERTEPSAPRSTSTSASSARNTPSRPPKAQQPSASWPGQRASSSAPSTPARDSPDCSTTPAVDGSPPTATSRSCTPETPATCSKSPKSSATSPTERAACPAEPAVDLPAQPRAGLSSPTAPNWAISSSACGTDTCGQSSTTPQPSMMRMRRSVRPSEPRERRSSRSVRSGAETTHCPSRRDGYERGPAWREAHR